MVEHGQPKLSILKISPKALSLSCASNQQYHTIPSLPYTHQSCFLAQEFSFLPYNLTMWMVKNPNTNDPNLNLDSNINLPKLFPFPPLTQTNTNHHFLKPAAAEENGREFNIEQPVPEMGSSRWSPTPEQLLALEEMYRHGTRTPTAEQIQEIAVQLRRFGKIEGKNVFYWFQNHKARERQKRRRGVETNSKITTRFDIENIEKKRLSAADKGLRRTVHEVEETDNLVPHSSCSVHTKGHVSMHRTARIAESRVHEWSQLEKRNLQQQKKKQEYTWQAERKFLSFQELHQEPPMTQMIKTNLTDDIKEIETLELFPLFREEEDDDNGPKKDRKVPIQAINTAEKHQFFEFLPLKN